ncbi:hypothetical protein J2S00_001622 [Caldalkalibacillus uzonensis]|uniref:Uncharacterized protein n=1 Tax=Caldalkalibacillus uzonensis TaxID=353224 RepID=A0ABU0CSG4_9BACI|nr:hypothetical protein [Caldalkalibacillus uzonensis]MDQ0338836.1 hypothetical protein [Caldalkalibacillus uzonensis]
MAYCMIAVYAIPLLIIGIIRIVNPEWKKELWTQEKKEEAGS